MQFSITLLLTTLLASTSLAAPSLIQSSVVRPPFPHDPITLQPKPPFRPYLHNKKQTVRHSHRSLDISPDVDLDLLQNFQDLCIGIAVCNPVTVTDGKSRRDLISLDISPEVDVKVLSALTQLCVGIAVCNPVTVTDNRNSTCT